MKEEHFQYFGLMAEALCNEHTVFARVQAALF
jgi:hypothetical protein